MAYLRTIVSILATNNYSLFAQIESQMYAFRNTMHSNAAENKHLISLFVEISLRPAHNVAVLHLYLVSVYSCMLLHHSMCLCLLTIVSVYLSFARLSLSLSPTSMPLVIQSDVAILSSVATKSEINGLNLD